MKGMSDSNPYLDMGASPPGNVGDVVCVPRSRSEAGG